MQFLKHHNYTELDFAGTSLIMSDAAIEFKAELFYGDVVKAFVTAGDFSKAGFDIFYKLVNEKDGNLAATAKTGMVCFDYSHRKIVAIPPTAITELSR